MRCFLCPFGLWLALFMVGCNGAAGPDLLDKGKAALKQEKYDDAINLLKKCTEKMPQNAEAYNYLGAAYQGKGDQTLAVRAFEKSISVNPKYAPPLFNVGVMYHERQQFDRAIINLSRFVALQPDNVEGYFFLASAQFETEDLQNARSNFLRVEQADPTRPEVLNKLGVISAKLGQPREAETWLSSCTKLNPRYAPAFLNIAILYHHTLNKPTAALDFYQKFLELEPAGPSSDLARLSLAELKEAAPPVARGQEEVPKTAMVAPAPKPQPASADREKTEPARAPVEPPKPAPVAPPSPAISTQTNEATRPARIEVATLAGSRWPAQAFPKPTPGKRDEAVAQFQRGAQYQKDGLLDAAIFCYREALKLDPTLTAAYYNLGTALQGQNMLNQAIDSYLHAVSLQPGFTNARLNLAILFEAQGYRADAAEQYQAILREAPNDAKAHLALGRLYAGQPSTQSLSRQHYQRFLDLEPTSPEAKRVQQWLQENK